jgi:hypothetical protein
VLQRMTSLLCLASFAALLVVAAPPDNDHPFDGKWDLDKASSTASSEIPEHLEQQIKQKGSKITIVSSWREPQDGMAPLALLGVMTTELKLNADGSQATNQIGPFRQVSKTTQDGDHWDTDWTAQVNGAVVKGHWTRKLSDGGRGMILDISEQTPDGKNNQAHLVFHKK